MPITIDPEATLEDLYAQIPAIDCRGKCANSCGPIDMSDLERTRLRDLGVEIPVWTQEAAHRWANQERLDCPALGAFRQCTVYDARPLICRLWGVTEGMPCVWGCRPERYLTDDEGFALIAASMRIGGNDRLDQAKLRDIDAVMPDVRRVLAESQQRYTAIALRAHEREASS